MDEPYEPQKSDTEQAELIFVSGEKACYRIAKYAYLESLEEDIEAIKVPVEIVGYWIIATVRAGMFYFFHACILAQKIILDKQCALF